MLDNEQHMEADMLTIGEIYEMASRSLSQIGYQLRDLHPAPLIQALALLTELEDEIYMLKMRDLFFENDECDKSYSGVGR